MCVKSTEIGAGGGGAALKASEERIFFLNALSYITQSCASLLFSLRIQANSDVLSCMPPMKCQDDLPPIS
jgi:hypothetical protein